MRTNILQRYWPQHFTALHPASLLQHHHPLPGKDRHTYQTMLCSKAECFWRELCPRPKFKVRAQSSVRLGCTIILTIYMKKATHELQDDSPLTVGEMLHCLQHSAAPVMGYIASYPITGAAGCCSPCGPLGEAPERHDRGGQARRDRS